MTAKKHLDTPKKRRTGNTPTTTNEEWREFIFENSIPEPNSGCWLWMRSTLFPKSGCDNYGVTWLDGVQQLVHRVSWMMFRGKIPAGKLVLHKCDVKCCVNPDHLYIGNKMKNAIDALLRGKFKDGRKPRYGRSRSVAARAEYVGR